MSLGEVRTSALVLHHIPLPIVVEQSPEQLGDSDPGIIGIAKTLPVGLNNRTFDVLNFNVGLRNHHSFQNFIQHLLKKTKLKSARRSQQSTNGYQLPWEIAESKSPCVDHVEPEQSRNTARGQLNQRLDRKSTRLNSSH